VTDSGATFTRSIVFPAMDKVCSDLVVLELGFGSAAASETGMFLADNGARVIKVEPPTGDLFRKTLPSGWLVWNRGKESVVADLDGAEGRETVRQLLATADVVIEAFDSGRAEDLGLGFEDARQINPALIYCSIKGFAPTGPYAKIKGHDALVMAKAGAFTRRDFGFRPGPIFSGALIPSNGAAHMAERDPGRPHRPGSNRYRATGGRLPLPWPEPH